jgi:uncharacterized protein YdaT
MPWTAEEFKRKHNKNLTDKQAKKAAQIANRVLQDTGDEALAIKTANARMRLLKE